MQQVLKTIYAWFRLLSIDIVLGAVAGLIYFSKILKIRPPVYWVIAFVLAVWLIYLTDHLLDAIKNKQIHSFFYKHSLNIIMFLACLSGVLGALIFFLFPLKLLFFSALPGVCTMAYLCFAFYYPKILLKEVIIAILYVSSFFIFPIYLGVEISIAVVFSVITYGALVLANVLIFSLLGTKNSKPSPNRIKTLIYSALCFSAIINSVLYFTGLKPLLFVFLETTMGAALTLVPVMRKNNGDTDFGGAFADAVFIVPIVSVFI